MADGKFASNTNTFGGWNAQQICTGFAAGNCFGNGKLLNAANLNAALNYLDCKIEDAQQVAANITVADEGGYFPVDIEFPDCPEKNAVSLEGALAYTGECLADLKSRMTVVEGNAIQSFTQLNDEITIEQVDGDIFAVTVEHPILASVANADGTVSLTVDGSTVFTTPVITVTENAAGDMVSILSNGAVVGTFTDSDTVSSAHPDYTFADNAAGDLEVRQDGVLIATITDADTISAPAPVLTFAPNATNGTDVMIDGVVVYVIPDAGVVINQTDVNEWTYYQDGVAVGVIDTIPDTDQALTPGSVTTNPDGSVEVCLTTIWITPPDGIGAGTPVTALDDSCFTIPAPSAVNLSVTDAGGYFAGDNAESIFQEIGADCADKEARLAALEAETDNAVTGMSLSGTTLTLTDADGNAITQDLAPLIAGLGPEDVINGLTVVDDAITITTVQGGSFAGSITDDDTTNAGLSVVGGNLVLTDSDGNSVQVAADDIDTDTDTTYTFTVNANGTTTAQAVDIDGNNVGAAITIGTANTSSSLAQDQTTGVVTHTADDGTTSTAFVVSDRTVNVISYDPNRGALLEPVVEPACTTPRRLAGHVSGQTEVLSYFNWSEIKPRSSRESTSGNAIDQAAPIDLSVVADTQSLEIGPLTLTNADPCDPMPPIADFYAGIAPLLIGSGEMFVDVETDINGAGFTVRDSIRFMRQNWPAGMTTQDTQMYSRETANIPAIAAGASATLSIRFTVRVLTPFEAGSQLTDIVTGLVMTAQVNR